MLTLAWLAYDWNTHSQGKRLEGWWSLSVCAKGISTGREVERKNGRGRGRRTGERKERERKGGMMKREEVQQGVRGKGREKGQQGSAGNKGLCRLFRKN